MPGQQSDVRQVTGAVECRAYVQNLPHVDVWRPHVAALARHDLPGLASVAGLAKLLLALRLSKGDP